MTPLRTPAWDTAAACAPPTGTTTATGMPPPPRRPARRTRPHPGWAGARRPPTRPPDQTGPPPPKATGRGTRPQPGGQAHWAPPARPPDANRAPSPKPQAKHTTAPHQKSAQSPPNQLAMKGQRPTRQPRRAHRRARPRPAGHAPPPQTPLPSLSPPASHAGPPYTTLGDSHRCLFRPRADHTARPSPPPEHHAGTRTPQQPIGHARPRPSNISATFPASHHKHTAWQHTERTLRQRLNPGRASREHLERPTRCSAAQHANESGPPTLCNVPTRHAKYRLKVVTF